MFKIPGPRSPIRGENDTTDTNETMVRAMVRPVGRTYQHANREVLIDGDPLPLRLRRLRATPHLAGIPVADAAPAQGGAPKPRDVRTT